jgi:predicted anti-sigma-YlaC factor YlaD
MARYWWLTAPRGMVALTLALAIAAAIAAVVGAGLVLLRDRLSGLVDPEVFVGLLGVLTGLLRILGGFAAEERLGRRWTLGGIVLGTLEFALGALLLLTRGEPDLLAPIMAEGVQ